MIDDLDDFLFFELLLHCSQFLNFLSKITFFTEFGSNDDLFFRTIVIIPMSHQVEDVRMFHVMKLVDLS